MARSPSLESETAGGEVRPQADCQEVDVDSLQMVQPRSVGVEHVALHALSEPGLLDTLQDLGLSGVMQASLLGNLERLQKHSALGELLEVAFCALSHRTLYRASEVLMKHRNAIEARPLGAHEN